MNIKRLRASLSNWLAVVPAYNNLRTDARRAEALTYPDIGNGGTAGNLRTSAATTYRGTDGALRTLASSDDLWDLSGKTDTGAGEYVAHLLCVDDAGTASIVDGATAASEAAALAAVTMPTDVAVLGVYVAGESTDYSLALAAQGTIYQGVPNACRAAEAATLIDP